MAEQEPQYHPAVEKFMETSGPDIGRIKDKDIAESYANKEDDLKRAPAFIKDFIPTPEDRIKYEISAKAVEDAHIVGDIAADAMGFRPTTDEELLATVEGAKKSARDALASYETLQEVSKPANMAQEKEYLKKNLAEARKKIAEQGGQGH